VAVTDSASSALGETERLLFVCTANRARSPLAAALLRRELTRISGRRPLVEADSAGLRAIPDERVLRVMRDAARGHGVDLTQHRARAFELSMLESSQLFLTMTEVQRSALARLEPQQLTRTFTLKEWVRIHEAMSFDCDNLAQLALATHRARAAVAAADEPEDIVDPVGLPARQQAVIAAEIATLTRSVAETLFTTVIPRRPGSEHFEDFDEPEDSSALSG
jgi:low molecular weight protein-tyrosine phosphatase